MCSVCGCIDFFLFGPVEVIVRLGFRNYYYLRSELGYVTRRKETVSDMVIIARVDQHPRLPLSRECGKVTRSPVRFDTEVSKGDEKNSVTLCDLTTTTTTRTTNLLVVSVRKKVHAHIPFARLSRVSVSKFIECEEYLLFAQRYYS